MVDFSKHLQARLQKATSPSLHPPKRLPAAPRIVEVVPTLDDLDLLPSDRARIRTLTRKLGAANETMRELKANRDGFSGQLKSIFADTIGEKTKVDCDDWRVSYYRTTRASIDPKQLLARGVSPAVIAACTTKSENWALKVTARGEESEEDLE